MTQEIISNIDKKIILLLVENNGVLQEKTMVLAELFGAHYQTMVQRINNLVKFGIVKKKHMGKSLKLELCVDLKEFKDDDLLIKKLTDLIKKNE